MAPPRLKLSKKSQTPKTPQTKDEYLELAEEHEQAMGKHRAGDPAKALRFADRALEVYSQGLARFPRDFELAHFKAKLDLEKATDPRLAQVPGQSDLSVQLFGHAVASHRYALGIDPEDTDTLFNMAQALTGLAEAISEDDSVDNAQALQSVEEALQTQDRCFALQQKMYQDVFKAPGQGTAAEQQQPAADESAGSENVMREEEEVQIVDTVTASTLLDTVITQIETLSLLCSFLSSTIASSQSLVSPTHPQGIEAYKSQIEATTQAILEENRDMIEPRLADVMLPLAVFRGNQIELMLRLGASDVASYEQELSAAFSRPGIVMKDPEVLIAATRAKLSFNSALADREVPSSPEECQSRWKMLWEERARLTTAAGTAGIDQETLATTHMLRGDISLLLHRLGYSPSAYPQAVASSADLSKAAATYYRNASKLFAAAGSSFSEEKSICELRGAVVAIMQACADGQAQTSIGGNGFSFENVPDRAHLTQPFKAMVAKDKSWVGNQIEDMASEGLITQELLAGLLKSMG